MVVNFFFHSSILPISKAVTEVSEPLTETENSLPKSNEAVFTDESSALNSCHFSLTAFVLNGSTKVLAFASFKTMLKVFTLSDFTHTLNVPSLPLPISNVS